MPVALTFENSEAKEKEKKCANFKNWNKCQLVRISCVEAPRAYEMLERNP